MSDKRHEARYQRRKAARNVRRSAAIGCCDDFERVVNADSLCTAFKQCKKGVSWKESVQRYEANLLPNIFEAKRKLLEGEDVRKGFVEFDVNERGKIRHIKSVHISERVIQKSLCTESLVPILRYSLVYDNGASLKGKGVSFSLNRLTAHLRRYYRENGNSNEGYALQIDFKNYFESINHSALFRVLERQITDKRLLALTKSFVSAFGPEKSLGLGSEVSQICALAFPNTIDHYIKEVWRMKYFARHNDDIYIIHTSKEKLKLLLSDIRSMCSEIGITLSEKKTRIVKLSQGVCYLKGKYILTKSGKIIRLSRGKGLIYERRKLKKFCKKLSDGKMTMNDVRTSYQSWRGGFKKRFDCYNKLKKMDKLYNELFIYNHAQMSA